MCKRANQLICFQPGDLFLFRSVNLEPEGLPSYRNVFLIREPGQMLVSYAKVRESPTLADIGLKHQHEIFTWLEAESCAPLVVDGDDIRKNPGAVLSRLCQALEIPFTEAMLTWPAGGRSEDGSWARAHIVNRTWQEQPAIWLQHGFHGGHPAHRPKRACAHAVTKEPVTVFHPSGLELAVFPANLFGSHPVTFFQVFTGPGPVVLRIDISMIAQAPDKNICLVKSVLFQQ